MQRASRTVQIMLDFHKFMNKALDVASVPQNLLLPKL
jgi:hypothetical protein